jgi:peptidoglycan-associated lipoprotein
MNTKIATILLLASASGLAACSKKAPETLPPEPVQTVRPVTPTPPATPTGPSVGTQAHFAGAVGSSTTIYFETDRYNVDSQDAAALQAQAQYFARYPQLTFTIEGHADERGTREYNIALGEKRANSAKAYLVSLGVDPNRIAVVSYGKERPVALASDEAAWAQNRRAASVLIN